MVMSAKAGAGNHIGKIFDVDLQLWAEGSTIADGTFSAVLALGDGLVDADLMINVSALTGACSATVQFSIDEAFTTPVPGVSAPLVAGPNVIPFRNAPGNGLPYPYMRVAAAVGTSLTAGGFVAKK